MEVEDILVHDGDAVTKQFGIKFNIRPPRDQNGEAAQHLRYAASLKLPTLEMRPNPLSDQYRCVIVGGSPSVKDHLEEIRALSLDPRTCIFALNWTHTWLINNGIVPFGCVFFEIDAEPDSILETLHPDVTYYVCSHCHEKTFDHLKDHKVVLWHCGPNPESPEQSQIYAEHFQNTLHVGGGTATLLRTIGVALALGYRNFDLFGNDHSFPENAKTHVEGYPAIVTPEDAFPVWARQSGTGETRKFMTVGYLALGVEEFKKYCQANHAFFRMRVHGDGLLPFVHREMWPEQYRGESAAT